MLSKRAETNLPQGWPAFFERIEDYSTWDLDGNKYLDLGLMGVGVNILGYSHPKVDELATALQLSPQSLPNSFRSATKNRAKNNQRVQYSQVSYASPKLIPCTAKYSPAKGAAAQYRRPKWAIITDRRLDRLNRPSRTADLRRLRTRNFEINSSLSVARCDAISHFLLQIDS